MAHIPLRMCAGCRKMLPKHTLIKIVKQDGVPVIDEKQKMFGRGIYLCKNTACLDMAKKKRAVERQFKVQTDADFYAGIERYGGG